ncbi:hypothetical protein B0H14DRAFT_3424852 [Mycena olivaceomarginata]|nr:hypothetical protein B0H14DRAFT_3424852 [Mycena olivaceomarginata]
MNSQEIKRLVGLDYGLEPGLNERHIRMFRKAAEIHDVCIAETTFGQLRNLRIVMNDDNLGDLHSSTPRFRYLNLPTAEGRRRLVAYRVAHDIYYKAQGGIKNAAAKYILQDAEQAWHDWVVDYLAARGRTRPRWALEPLPTFDRVVTRRLATQPPSSSSPIRSARTRVGRSFPVTSVPVRRRSPVSSAPPSPPPPPAASLQSFSHPAAQFFFANWIRPLPRQAQLPCNIRPRSTPLPSVIRLPSPPPPPATSLQSRYRSKRGR